MNQIRDNSSVGATDIQFDIEATDFQTPPNTLSKMYSSPATWALQKSFQYDLNGNLIAEYAGPVKTRSYTWDSQDQLIAIHYAPEDSQNQSRTEFVYDGGGRRTKIVEVAADGSIESTRIFLWNGIAISQERDSAGAILKRFYGAGLVIGASTTPADADTLFYTKDHLGSTRQAIDATGTVRAAYEYSPYGVATKLFGTLDLSFLYTGHLQHTRSGLTLAPYRAYDSTRGMWISRDPIAENGGLNLHQYCASNPMNYYDPLGLELVFSGQDGGWAKWLVDKMRNCDCKYIPKMIKALDENTTYVIHIDAAPGIESYYFKHNRTVVWDSRRNSDGGRKLHPSDAAVLAHELMHAYDHLSGNQERKFDSSRTTDWEERAVRMENAFRKCFWDDVDFDNNNQTYKPRTTYGGYEVPAPEASPYIPASELSP